MSNIVFSDGHKYYEDIEKKFCCDLTNLFGAGNEPTLEEFERVFPKPYYDFYDRQEVE